MKDYLVTVTVKNNIFLKAMEENGFKTAVSLSRASGVSPGTIGDYLNLKQTPLGRNGFKQSILLISKTLKRLPEDLFPPQHLEKGLNTNKVHAEVCFEEFKELLGQKTPEQLLEFKEMKNKVHLALSQVKGRDRKVLEYRFGFTDGKEKTLKQCGVEFGINQERVRQIEARGLRFLRKPENQEPLQRFAAAL